MEQKQETKNRKNKLFTSDCRHILLLLLAEAKLIHKVFRHLIYCTLCVID